MSSHRRSVRPLAFSLAGACAAALLAVQPVSARQTAADIPTVRQTLGYDSGQEITRAADVRRYFEALRAAAPDRVAIGDYATTWEGRPLFWAAVGSPANIARLDQIKADARALADPRRTSPQQAAALIADQPVLVWMAYSVHGNEISPADAAMQAARRLLTDPTAQAWLANTVVVFVPTQNPDGRERFLNSFASGRGSLPNPDPASAERDEPWPSGRYNHYLFDLNRDWFIQTQPETQGHAALVRDWRPQVVVDSHEMGSDETFFFPPEAEPLNPWIWPRTLENRALFGRNTGARFDAAGLAYFNRKVFDAFYPGYGDGWPGYLGAVSMTYEVGSARGLAARRSSGEVFTYADTVRAHLTATLATIETASRNHDRLLNDFYAYHRDGVAGRGAYVLSRASDPAAADRLAGLLVRSGIEVGVARQAFACAGQHRAGDYVINLAQPQRRMAEVLLTRDVPVPPDFLAEQERRRARGLGDEIYDVTAWSLPLMFGVDATRCDSAPSVAVEARGPELVTPAAVRNAEARYGFLVAPGSAQPRFLAAALQAGLTVSSADQPFTQNGRDWPAGTLILPKAGAPADLIATLNRLAADTGAEVVGVDESWVERGAGFGSSDVVRLRAPRIALAWDSPTAPDAAGATRWLLERDLGYPVTVIRTASLGEADLAHYQVLILPEGRDYASVLGEAGVKALHEWVSRGGTLISLGTATRLLADADSDMLASRREDGALDKDEDKPAAPARIANQTDYAALLAHSDHGPDSVAGVLARAHVDPDHWIGAGLPSELNVLVRGADIYAPLMRGEGVNAVRFEGSDQMPSCGPRTRPSWATSTWSWSRPWAPAR